MQHTAHTAQQQITRNSASASAPWQTPEGIGEQIPDAMWRQADHAVDWFLDVLDAALERQRVGEKRADAEADAALDEAVAHATHAAEVARVTHNQYARDFGHAEWPEWAVLAAAAVAEMAARTARDEAHAQMRARRRDVMIDAHDITLWADCRPRRADDWGHFPRNDEAGADEWRVRAADRWGALETGLEEQTFPTAWEAFDAAAEALAIRLLAARS